MVSGGFLGRKAVKDSKMLWRAKPKGKGPLFVELTLSDGRTVRWQQDRSNGKPHWTLEGETFTDATILNTVVFGVEEVRNNLFGSPATAEKWLSTQLGITTDEVVGSVGALAEEVPYVWSLIQPFANSATPAVLVDSLKKRMRASKAEADTAQKLVEEMEHVAGPSVTDAELEAKRVQLRVAREAALLADRHQGYVEQIQENERAWQGANAELAQLGTPDSVDTRGVEVAQAVLTALNLVVSSFPDNTLCPCCHKALDQGMTTLQERQEVLAGFVAQAREATKAVERKQTLTAKSKGYYADAKKLADLLPPGYLDSWQFKQPEAHTDACSAKANAIGEELDELQRRRISTQAPGIAKATVERALQAYEGYQQAVKLVAEILALTVESAVEDFNEALAKIYPDHFGEPVLSLRPQVSVGVKRNGTVGAPSGGEEAVLLFAIATVISYLRGDKGMNILVMEDRALDSFTLGVLLNNWSECPYAQVFLPTTWRVSGEEGWSIVSHWSTEETEEDLETIPTTSTEILSASPAS
jgi:hypothetical protein